jgi:hypothetical protein
MVNEEKSRLLFRRVLIPGAVLVIVALIMGIAFAVQARHERLLMADLERTQSELRVLGDQIAGIKDTDLRSMNDYIGAYAQIEPLQDRYDEKLQKFIVLYNLARERDSHRGVLNIENFRGGHHPETWDKMWEIITLVQQINEITKREGQVIHGMASLPESDRVRYWHEEFMP